MKAVFLDAASLDRSDLDFSALEEQLQTLELYPQTPPEAVAERIATCDIVLVNKVPLDRDCLAHSAAKLICLAATAPTISI